VLQHCLSEAFQNRPEASLEISDEGGGDEGAVAFELPDRGSSDELVSI
jgi:hypothetical protein